MFLFNGRSYKHASQNSFLSSVHLQLSLKPIHRSPDECVIGITPKRNSSERNLTVCYNRIYLFNWIDETIKAKDNNLSHINWSIYYSGVYAGRGDRGGGCYFSLWHLEWVNLIKQLCQQPIYFTYFFENIDGRFNIYAGIWLMITHNN